MAERNPKSEGRNEREIRNPKAEIRNANARAGTPFSDFGFRPSFGFRISDFGFNLRRRDKSDARLSNSHV